ncbi:MAG: DUF4388 domain-containing protein, partial [Planctomycetota bacterium]|nr:DUF4388 domain-containing protein [Planctomycetota bacterium]
MTDSLDTLTDDELEFLLQAPESGATINALELEEARHGATMRGDIEQIGLTDILQTLALSKMEGVLRVCNPLESRYLYIADGYIRPIMPTATRRRRLLSRLVQAGCVELQELRRAISERRPAPVAMEDLLTEAALVRVQDVDDAANVIFDEELFSLFTWQRGTFELFRSEEAAAALGDAFGSAPEYEIHSLLLEVARRSDDWARILDTIGSLDEIPTRSSAKPHSGSRTPEQHAIWSCADGQSTYRQLAEETTLDLFDFARAAASLYSEGAIRNVAESDFLEIAAAFAETGDDGRAAVTLQALLERSEDPTPRVTLQVAEIYDRIGMRRKAVSVLLEAAQRPSAREDAHRLAHAAYEIDPSDVATLHFLRSVFVAMGDDAAAEDVRVITLALVDALIVDGRAERALEILSEAKDGSADDDDQDFLLREARAHQRLGDDEVAVARYVSLASAHIAAGERQLAAAAYEQALRIEPRREIVRALAATRRTRVGAVVRLTAMGLVITMIAAMGWIWLEQHQRQGAMGAAMNELEAVLSTGDHAAARRALATWDAQLGDEEAFQDLESRVAFAESAQRQREAAAARAATAAKMQRAAETLAAGRVHDAILAYSHALDGAEDRATLSEIASRRLRSLAERVQQATSRLAGRLPPDPKAVLDPESLTKSLGSLQSQAPRALLNAHQQLTQIQERG